MHTLSLGIAGFSVLALLTPSVAFADSVDLTTQPSVSASPNTLDIRIVEVVGPPASLEQVTYTINRGARGETTAYEPIIQTEDIPILNSILDEDGDVNLPMGVRFFNPMGDYAIGFGSDFR